MHASLTAFNAVAISFCRAGAVGINGMRFSSCLRSNGKPRLRGIDEIYNHGDQSDGNFPPLEAFSFKGRHFSSCEIPANLQKWLDHLPATGTNSNKFCRIPVTESPPQTVIKADRLSLCINAQLSKTFIARFLFN